MRDDLGLSQRFAQNAGDVVQLIAEFFAPGAVAKGISSASKIVGAAKFRSALGERFGLFKGDPQSLDLRSEKGLGYSKGTFLLPKRRLAPFLKIRRDKLHSEDQ